MSVVTAALAALWTPAPVPAWASQQYPSNPCDAVPALPQCVAALGPLRDVSASWREYQAATVQVVPISDYAADPEDRPPPVGAGLCGTERSHPAADGTPVPASTVQAQPPAGVPAPPGTHGPYCVLRYLPTDFDPICTGCHRVLIDYAAIPAGNALSPGADGHWAGRITSSLGLTVSLPVNGHSPNVKNLCADKFFNPSPGSECDQVAPFDAYGGGLEGDTSIYHHYPLEGRYYNGPAYLAGDGAAVPYHWVLAAYFDLDTGGATGTVWYGAGYRGRGDAAPDTDQSYACLCEVPPLGHSAVSPSFALTAALTGGQGGPGGGGGGSGGAPGAGTGAQGGVQGAEMGLPNTAAGGMAAGPAAVAVLALVAAARLRRHAMARRRD